MDYSELSVTQLRELAKDKDIKKVSAMKKQELIDVLSLLEASKKIDKKPLEEVKKTEEAKKAEKAEKAEAVKKTEEDKKTVEIKKQPKAEKNGQQSRPVQSPAQVQSRSAQSRTQQPKPVQSAVQQPKPVQSAVQQSKPAQNAVQQSKPAQNAVQQPKPVQNAVQQSKPAQNVVQPQKTVTNAVQEDVRTGMSPELETIDSGETKEGILEVMADGFGFVRCDNFLPGENDVYVSPAQLRKFNLKTGDIITGNTRIRNQGEKFAALLYVKTVNGRHPSEAQKRPKFENLTPIFPYERIHLETPGCSPAMRIVDLLSPIGKGQRGMIVSQPKAGKTTLLKQVAKAITSNYPDIHLIILLIDERPEEVTDMKESIEGKNVEVIYSTFDELPENHKRVSEMVIERAKRLVEHKQDVVILLDSITRLARAYNLTCTASGRTLSGGLDPAALHMPKKFFGAARCMREGGSLTILATALVDTGSRMDDVVFEEFKGTGNMELVLDRDLSEKRIFPAIDLPKSGTRRDDLLLSQQEMEANDILRHAFNSAKSDTAVEKIINMFANTRTNNEFCELVKKTKLQ